MRVVLQRVKWAQLSIDNQLISKIGPGLLAFVGITDTDTPEQVDWIAKKMIELRIFEDETGKMNLSVNDVAGEILLVSQFTLYANCDRGRRPDFIAAAKPAISEPLYQRLAIVLGERGISPSMGIFGADMQIELLNDGPVTIILDRE